MLVHGMRERAGEARWRKGAVGVRDGQFGTCQWIVLIKGLAGEREGAGYPSLTTRPCGILKRYKDWKQDTSSDVHMTA